MLPGPPQWPVNGALMVLNSGYLGYIGGLLGGLGILILIVTVAVIFRKRNTYYRA